MFKVLIFIGVLFLLDYYVFNALGGVLKNVGEGKRNVIILFYWLPTILLVTLFIDKGIGDVMPDSIVTYAGALVFIVYFTKLVIAIPFLLEDIFRGITYITRVFKTDDTAYDPSRSKFIRQAAIGVASIPFATLLYGILGNQYRFKVRKKDIPIDNLPRELDGLKIVQISDIHAGTFVFKNPVNTAVEMIAELQPDIVVFTGDLVNNRADEAERFKDIFSQIKAPYGVYSILGNHDYGDYVNWSSPEEKKENLEHLVQIQKEMGWELLRNEHKKIEIKGVEVSVIGVDNFSELKRFPRLGDLEKAHRGTERSALKILLSHDPSHWDYEVNTKYRDIPLTLSGHTHGFQFGIEIPGYIKWSPSQYMYKQWAGLYKKGNQYIYVNRGLGSLGYPGRVGVLPEITALTLRSV